MALKSPLGTTTETVWKYKKIHKIDFHNWNSVLAVVRNIIENASPTIFKFPAVVGKDLTFTN